MRKPARATGKPRAAPMRCAIYTRKSSEEGLEQEFNSLDAQREACEAYIRSQRHEGWVCLPGMYDDGGISGATLERLSLKRLLAEIEAGAIDAVVVYKVDRLTRSLADFAKIVEVFDAKGVSFVSVTHANKKGQRYRYYVSQALIKGQRGAAPLGRRVPAGELEALVEHRLAAFLSAQTEVFAAIEPEGADATESSGLIARAAELARTWPEFPPAERRRMLLALLARIDIHRDSVEIRLLGGGLVSILEGENNFLDRKHPAEENT